MLCDRGIDGPRSDETEECAPVIDEIVEVFDATRES
jgi:hypothetical protein